MTPVLNRPLLAGLAAFNPIFVCRGLTPPLPELWPRLKKWN